MALQTQTSMSSTSTATSTATSSSSTATSTGTSGGNTGFFTPNSSTPLVLAFLGVGLVAAGVILFLGWRRSQLARIWADNFQSRQSLRKDVDGSPKLWDLWTTKGNTGVGSGVGVGPGYGADAGTGTAHAGGSSSALVQSAAIVDHHQWAKDMAWESVMVSSSRSLEVFPIGLRAIPSLFSLFQRLRLFARVITIMMMKTMNQLLATSQVSH
ncbi:hypothetical protein BT96DRAFT_259905 [Gymnopus androsaceus JB14]|uniref:Uncharacterized protein n=1 Tax=Gymnopus androsaceus JB14 TaxID=1447944 RepID=A0A6A4H6S3_9AGAR|nr:hypothetical protein BT96DRAFT_259905 [Gymnopus androsaceus JB14]